MDLWHVLAQYRFLTPFALVAARLADDTAPISRFVANLQSKPSWTTADVRAYFGQAVAGRRSRRSHRTLTLLVPEYGAFLDSHGFHPSRDEPADSAEFVHDAIGHIALGNPVTPIGELYACSGMAGFSHSVGIDYFINALLMFSFGHQLFDDVPPARVAITPDVGAAIGAAYDAGACLAEAVGYSDRGKHDTLEFVMGSWKKILQQAGRRRND